MTKVTEEFEMQLIDELLEGNKIKVNGRDYDYEFEDAKRHLSVEDCEALSNIERKLAAGVDGGEAVMARDIGFLHRRAVAEMVREIAQDVFDERRKANELKCVGNGVVDYE